ncbi:Os04g0168300, partial [Oryza sativa Japonica Group]
RPRRQGWGRHDTTVVGSCIAAAVAVGIMLGCLCTFLYPDGLLSCCSNAALHWPRQVNHLCTYLPHPRRRWA